MTTATKVQSITILGKRWFQRSYGNTYFSAEILVDGVPVHRIEKEYGYGEMYQQASWKWLAENGYVSPERYKPGGLQPAWQYCHDHGIELVSRVFDVERERDL